VIGLPPAGHPGEEPGCPAAVFPDDRGAISPEAISPTRCEEAAMIRFPGDPFGSTETKLAEKSLIEKGFFGNRHTVLQPDRPEAA
jgi:hypothetical protein